MSPIRPWVGLRSPESDPLLVRRTWFSGERRLVWLGDTTPLIFPNLIDGEPGDAAASSRLVLLPVTALLKYLVESIDERLLVQPLSTMMNQSVTTTPRSVPDLIAVSVTRSFAGLDLAA